jgi:hypothetical protein
MKPTKRFLIWAGNQEKDLIAKAREYFKALEPKSQILTRNGDAYSGPGDVEKCDGAYVQAKYSSIIHDFKTAGLLLLNEEIDEGTLHRRSEGNATSPNESANPPAAGNEDPSPDRHAAVGTGADGNGLGHADYVPNSRRRKRPRGQTQSGAQEL